MLPSPPKISAILLCLFLWSSVCLAEKHSYSIATVAWAGWSPLHVAEQMGFWSSQGISVTVKSYDDPIVILEAIRAGRIDFAMDMAGSLVGIYMDGTPVVMIAETNWSHGGDKIIIQAGDTIHRNTGGPLGVFLNLPSCWYFLGCYLKEQNLKLDDFRIVQLRPDELTEQFIVGRLPVIVNYVPWTLKAVTRGKGIVLATSAQYEGCIPEGMWMYKQRLKDVPAEDIKKVLRGWTIAAAWVNRPENQKAYYDILNRRTYAGLATYSDRELGRLRGAVKIHGPADMRERNRTGGGLYKYLESLRAFLKDNGRLKKDFSAEDLFENRFIMEVLNSPDAKNPRDARP